MQVMTDDNFDIEDDGFERLLADKQHKQLMSALKQLIGFIKTDHEYGDKTFQALSKYNQDLSLFLVKIENVLEKQSKDLPVIQTNDNSQLIESIVSLSDEMNQFVLSQNKIIELLSIKPTRLKPVKKHGWQIDYVDVEWENISKK